MQKPLVSIVTPSFNQGQFIEETIESVLEQDYPHIEYIVVDGGSTDATSSILSQYGSRLQGISEPDEGQADAINKGWRMSSGQIWSWLNSDDALLPGAVSAAVEAFADHREAGMVYGNSLMVNREGQVLAVHSAQWSKLQRFRPFHRYVPFNVPQPAAFLRADIVRGVGFLDPTLHYAMDYDLFLRMAEVAPLVHIPETVAIMRLYEGTKTSMNVLNNQQEKLDVLKRHRRTWFMSTNLLRFLRYKLWRRLPDSLRNFARHQRGAPRDRVYLETRSK